MPTYFRKNASTCTAMSIRWSSSPTASVMLSWRRTNIIVCGHVVGAVRNRDDIEKRLPWKPSSKIVLKVFVFWKVFDRWTSVLLVKLDRTRLMRRTRSDGRYIRSKFDGGGGDGCNTRRRWDYNIITSYPVRYEHYNTHVRRQSSK